jgi:hypothetical protein
MKTRHLLPALCCLALAEPASAEIPAQLNYQGRVAVQGTNFHGTGQFKFALVDAGTNLNQTATASGIATAMVTSISVNSGGSGYTTPPAVTIAPPNDPEGVQATATATISGGVVTAINITAAGSGYFSNPVQVTIAPPPENIEHQVYWSNAGDLAPNEVPSTSVSLPVDKGLYAVRLGDTAVTNMAAFNPDIFYTPLFLRVWFDDGSNGFQQLTPDQPLGSAPYALQARLAESVAPNSIGAAQLATGAVTSAKLGAGAVTTLAFAAGAVTSSALADGAVGSSKMAAGAAAANLVNQNVQLGAGSFTNVYVTGPLTANGLILGNQNVVAVGEVIGNTDVRAVQHVRAGFDVIATYDIHAGRDITYVGTLTDVSDARLKDLGTAFTAGLDTIAKIQPLHYRFKLGNALHIPSDTIQVGVSAQALQAALPEAVTQRADGYLGVSQEPVVWALVNAVKELQAENEALKARVESLEADGQ